MMMSAWGMSGVAAMAMAGALWSGSPVDALGRELYDHRLSRPYISGGVTVPHWTFGGNTLVTGDQVRLTGDRQSQVGHIWNTKAMLRSDWEVTFEYKVHGQGTRLFGDGFAFWFVSTETFSTHAQNGFLGSTFGGPTKFDGMLLSFDTYRNGNFQHQFPWIGIMHGTGDNSYNADNDNKDNELDGCLHKFRNLEETTMVRLINMRGTVGVYTSRVRRGFPQEWEECILVTDIWLPRIGHFGFTAHTGEVADNHDIIHFNANLINYAEIPKRQRDAMNEANHGPAAVPDPTGTGSAAPQPKISSRSAAEIIRERHEKAKYEHAFHAEERQRHRDNANDGGLKTFILSFLQVLLSLCCLAVVIGVAVVLYSKSNNSRNNKRFT